jgi:hypothetical protein
VKLSETASQLQQQIAQLEADLMRLAESSDGREQELLTSFDALCVERDRLQTELGSEKASRLGVEAAQAGCARA